MYKTDASPYEVLRWEHRKTAPELIEMARSGTLWKLGYVIAFETPPEYRSLGDYILVDGHKRVNAARKAKRQIRLMIIQNPEDFEHADPEYQHWSSMPNDKFKAYRSELLKDALSFNRGLKALKDIAQKNSVIT